MGHAWVRSQQCGYWCPGAKAPGHQYQQRWLSIHCIGPISYKNIAHKVKSIRKWNHILKKNDPVIKGLNSTLPRKHSSLELGVRKLDSVAGNVGHIAQYTEENILIEQLDSFVLNIYANFRLFHHILTANRKCALLLLPLALTWFNCNLSMDK